MVPKLRVCLEFLIGNYPWKLFMNFKKDHLLNLKFLCVLQHIFIDPLPGSVLGSGNSTIYKKGNSLS